VKPDLPLRVIDSTGKLVGNVAGVDLGIPILSFEFDSIHFTLAVTRSQFVQLSVPALFYASTNCTGPAFVLDTGSLFAPVHLEGTTLYLGDTRIPSHTENLSSNGIPGQCSTQPRTSSVFNTIVLTNFPSQWSAPFKLKSAADAR
jgi:hypothetical protein